MSKPFTDIDGKALEALIARVTEAKENNLALSPEDCQLLLDALTTLIGMQIIYLHTASRFTNCVNYLVLKNHLKNSVI